MKSHFKVITYSFFILLVFLNGAKHPIYMSVTEINHNYQKQILEISCKIFTGDFENTLRKKSKIKIDLLNPINKKSIDQLVEQYIHQHLRIYVNNQNIEMQFLGYEQDEESVQCYFQAGGIKSVKKITVNSNLLYDFKPEQISIIHVIVNNQRKSIRLNNPEEKAEFDF